MSFDVVNYCNLSHAPPPAQAEGDYDDGSRNRGFGDDTALFDSAIDSHGIVLSLSGT